MKLDQFSNFQWDNTKAKANLNDHGIAFSFAVGAFKDHFAVEWFDEREDYGEERINRLAMCEGLLLHITYTERDDFIRLISARRAEKHEQDHYYRENTL